MTHRFSTLIFIVFVIFQKKVYSSPHILNKKNISIALTSEYLGAPSSSYGHVFLVFHDQEYPELTAPILQFTAFPDTKNLFSYLGKGLLGGFSGNFNLGFLFEKDHEYISKEQRQIYFYRLGLSREEKNTIISFYEDVKNQYFPYYFFSKNCASYLDWFLSKTIGTKEIPDVFIAPIEIIYNLRPRISQTLRQDPLVNVLKNKFAQLPPKTKKNIKNSIKENDYEQSAAINKKFTGSFLKYDFLKNSSETPFPESELDFFDRSFSNLGDYFQKKQLIHNLYAGKKGEHFIIGFIPSILDIFTYQKDSLHESTLNLLHLELIKKENIKLYKFNLIEMALYPSYDFITPKMSWELLLGHSNNSIHLTGGLGLSKKFGHMTLSAILNSTLNNKHIKENTNLTIQAIGYTKIIIDQKFVLRLEQYSKGRLHGEINFINYITNNTQVHLQHRRNQNSNENKLVVRQFF